MVNENISQLISSAGDFAKTMQTTNPAPIMGYILRTTNHHRNADIQLTTAGGGIMDAVQCLGIPVIGDSVIIVFPEGNYEQAIAICPRGLPVPEEAIKDYYTYNCFNYLNNGDFHKQAEGYTGEFTIIEGESCTNTSNYACQLEAGQTIIKEVDLSQCNKEYFKFQAYYRGIGTIQIHVYDTNTNETIETLPYSMRYPTKTWTTKGNRWIYLYNKETYPRIEGNNVHENITIEITNNTSITEEDLPSSMLIDGLLVFEENSDQSYYHSVQDQMEDL
ncbi:MAG: hypothetical protein BZ136_08950 [Methanosphaera sp. rholeuAM74]|nr:MAG: hypothetical protein BZ136_08950 [Methanosphaera sp. rholeuAM74]